MVFLFSGAALALCVPTFGAFLFLACWLPVRSSWVGFGLAGSGRAALDQGSFWLFFWVATLAPEMVTWILPKCTKTNGFEAIYAQRAARRIFACEPLCSESSCFLERFCEFWRALLVQNGLVDANLEASFGVSNVLFHALCGFFLDCQCLFLGEWACRCSVVACFLARGRVAAVSLLFCADLG